MNAISLAMTDSSTMLRRNLLRMRRYPSMTVLLIGLPVLFLLLFVYVFGGTLGAGLATGIAAGADGRAEYLTYVTPAIMLMAAASAAQGTAISVAMDRTEGILARFRTMAISPSSVLTGHVLGSVIQSLLAMGTLLGVSVLLGFRPDTSPLGWLALFVPADVHRVRVDLVVRCVRPGVQECRDGQQPADVPGHPAVPEQRLRPGRVDARRSGVVRRTPAVHADHRDGAWVVHRRCRHSPPR